MQDRVVQHRAPHFTRFLFQGIDHYFTWRRGLDVDRRRWRKQEKAAHYRATLRIVIVDGNWIAQGLPNRPLDLDGEIHRLTTPPRVLPESRCTITVMARIPLKLGAGPRSRRGCGGDYADQRRRPSRVVLPGWCNLRFWRNFRGSSAVAPSRLRAYGTSFVNRLAGYLVAGARSGARPRPPGGSKATAIPAVVAVARPRNRDMRTACSARRRRVALRRANHSLANFNEQMPASRSTNTTVTVSGTAIRTVVMIVIAS